MLFSSIAFIFYFLPLIILGVILIPGLRNKNIFLVVMSLVFYAWGEGSLVILLIGSALLNYFFGRLIGKMPRPKFYLTLGIIVNLLILFYCKYFVFLISSLVSAGVHIHKPTIHLPIGISFFTFQGLSYLIDVSRKKQAPEKNVLKVMLYIALFPQLLAGPIIKYHEIFQQLSNRVQDPESMLAGIKRFIIGLAKKMLIANPLGLLSNEILNNDYAQLGSLSVWVGVLAFMLQIYFDFSGYSDMAIGLGRMLGFTYPENFNFPYISQNIREFWRRWHISLSTWLRDYLFLPLAYSFSRKLKKDKYFGIRSDKWIYAYASIITMLVCGLWHGANWNFILWGLYFGGFMVLEQFFLGRWLKKLKSFSVIYMLLVVFMGWILFRSETLQQTGLILNKMFSFNNSGRLTADVFLNREYMFTLCIALIFTVPWHKWISITSRKGLAILPYAEALFLLIIFVLSSMALVTNTYTPFIYFRF